MAARSDVAGVPRADRITGTVPSCRASRARVRCWTPMLLSCSACASRSASCRVFFARGVNGIWPRGAGPGRSGALPPGPAGRAATPAARQPGQRALPPGGPPALAGGGEVPGEGVRAEDCFDPGADDVEVDADESQRLAVEAAQRVGRLTSPDGAQYFRLDTFGRD